jgi:hypothetical protein
LKLKIHIYCLILATFSSSFVFNDLNVAAAPVSITPPVGTIILPESVQRAYRIFTKVHQVAVNGGGRHLLRTNPELVKGKGANVYEFENLCVQYTKYLLRHENVRENVLRHLLLDQLDLCAAPHPFFRVAVTVDSEQLEKDKHQVDLLVLLSMILNFSTPKKVERIADYENTYLFKDSDSKYVLFSSQRYLKWVEFNNHGLDLREYKGNLLRVTGKTFKLTPLAMPVYNPQLRTIERGKINNCGDFRFTFKNYVIVDESQEKQGFTARFFKLEGDKLSLIEQKQTKSNLKNFKDINWKKDWVTVYKRGEF